MKLLLQSQRFMPLQNPTKMINLDCNAMSIGNQDQSRNLYGLRIDFQAKKPEETPSTTSAPIDQDVIDWDGPNDAW